MTTALREALEHTALGWIKPELDETLRLAKAELEDYVEDQSDVARMRLCAGYLHQVQGTLRMGELYAPAMVAEEVEQVALRRVGGAVRPGDGSRGAGAGRGGAARRRHRRPRRRLRRTAARHRAAARLPRAPAERPPRHPDRAAAAAQRAARHPWRERAERERTV